MSLVEQAGDLADATGPSGTDMGGCGEATATGSSGCAEFSGPQEGADGTDRVAGSQ
jgi:hypothetical protein